MANFAIMGFGTVGSGVAEVLRMNGESIARKLGEPLNLKYILDVRDLSATPYAKQAVKDFAVLENDPELDVVVESIGGAKVPPGFAGGQACGHIQQGAGRHPRQRAAGDCQG